MRWPRGGPWCWWASRWAPTPLCSPLLRTRTGQPGWSCSRPTSPAGIPARLRGWGEFFRCWPVPFPTRAAAVEFLGDGPLGRAWAAELEPVAGGFRPRFDPAVMQATIEAVHVPRWEEWQAVTASTTVVFAPQGMFTAARKDAFVAARPGTRRIDLVHGTHDAHLDAPEQWSAALRETLAGLPWDLDEQTQCASKSPRPVRDDHSHVEVAGNLDDRLPRAQGRNSTVVSHPQLDAQGAPDFPSGS